MKIAVLSDIHSNYPALRACVDYALEEGATHFLFLGDYVSDCAYPQKTMKLLYHIRDHYPSWFIKGNREEYLINHKYGAKDGWTTPSSAGGSLLYTFENLTPQDIEFYESLEISGRMKLEGYPDFLYCHGSMEESRGSLKFGSDEAKNALKSISETMIIAGHTHKQGIYEYDNKKIVNVGSVGVPFFYDGKAQFGMLTSKDQQWDVSLHQIDYNRHETITDIYESNLHGRAGTWAKLVEETILTGIDRASECFHMVLDNYKERTGSSYGCHLYEEDWEKAAETLGIY